MAQRDEPTNPFYVLLIVLGIAFLITACAYGTMAYRAIAPNAGQEAEHPLMALLDRRGIEIMGWELALLAFATFGAMWLDGVRTRQKQAKQPPDEDRPGF